MKIGTDVHTSPCVKQTASGGLLYSLGSSAQCTVMTERGGWEQGGPQGGDTQIPGCRLWGRTESDATDATWQQQQLRHFTVQQKLTKYCKATISQLFF